MSCTLHFRRCLNTALNYTQIAQMPKIVSCRCLTSDAVLKAHPIILSRLKSGLVETVLLFTFD